MDRPSRMALRIEDLPAPVAGTHGHEPMIARIQILQPTTADSYQRRRGTLALETENERVMSKDRVSGAVFSTFRVLLTIHLVAVCCLAGLFLC